MVAVIDCVFLAVAVLGPPALVFLLKRHGVLWGALVVWASLAAAGAVLGVLDPSSRNAWTHTFDLLWLCFGWLAGLIYCLPFYLAKLLYGRAGRSSLSS